MRHNLQTGTITFQATENLMAKPSGAVLLYKGASRSLQLTKNRALDSYIHQFCGMLGIQRRILRFMRPAEVEASAAAAASANLPDLVPITDHCHVQVQHCEEFHNAPKPLLKPALKELFNSGMHSDLTLYFQNVGIRCHKGILIARSPYFRKILTISASENGKLEAIALDQFHLQNECNATPQLFRLLLQWIYCADITIPDEFEDILNLHTLATHYEMHCLRDRCEEELILSITPQRVVDLLIILVSRESSPDKVLDHCKSTFLRNFPEVLEANQNLEEKLFKVPGLTLSLFQHVSELQRKKNKRKVHFAPVEAPPLRLQQE